MDAYGEYRGEEGVRARQREIDTLPTVQWKGRALYTLRCAADFGNGPHDVHLPESTLWALISLWHFRCVYHR